MDDELCRQFFLQPQMTFQRRYEAFRAYFIDGQPLAQIAARFGYRLSSLKSLVCRFRAACRNGGPAPFFFRTDVDALRDDDGLTSKTVPNQSTSPMPDSGA